MSVKIDPEGPRRSKEDPVRLRKLRQTSQAAFAASSFSSWLHLESLVRSRTNNPRIIILETTLVRRKYRGYDDTMNNPGNAAY